MGIIFGKSKKNHHPKVTEQDKAVLQLKQQRDKIKQYQKRIQSKLEDERNLARQLLQNGQKERALSILKKKKYFENLLNNTDNLLHNLETLVDDISFAQIEVQVVEGLEQGNKALKELNKILSIDRVEAILEETKEGVEKQREIDELISGAFTEQDEADLLDELEQITQGFEKEAEENIKLPQVPETEVKEPNVEEEEEEKVGVKDVVRPKRRKEAVPAS